MAVRKGFEEPRALSVEEAIGTDDEALREKMAERLLQDEEAVKSEIEAEKKELKRFEAELEQNVIKYERDDSDREPVERAYEKKLGILHRMAGQFHPLSDEGKKALQDAVACRKEFEGLIGPLLTTITKNNLNLFQSVLPQDLGEDVACGRRSAFGAIRTDNGRTYGVGAIVYFTDRIPTYEGGVLRIEWLYVHEKFRKRGVARFLLGELLHQMIRSSLPAVSCEFPAKGEYNQVLAYILSGWSFEFGTWISPEALIRI
ncbi:MAG: GNAT family N-acetyltransferase, partial [Lachnospiraceae bacterium]|nr:GNAT family N-acetyltransferase [Lachnospiraceae bacterium]